MDKKSYKKKVFRQKKNLKLHTGIYYIYHCFLSPDEKIIQQSEKGKSIFTAYYTSSFIKIKKFLKDLCVIDTCNA